MATEVELLEEIRKQTEALNQLIKQNADSATAERQADAAARKQAADAAKAQSDAEKAAEASRRRDREVAAREQRVRELRQKKSEAQLAAAEKMSKATLAALVSMSKTTSNIASINKAIGGASGALKAGSVLASAANMKTMATVLKRVNLAVSVVGAVVEPLINKAAELKSTFNALANSGGALGLGLTGMADNIIDMRLSTEEYLQAMQKNASAVAYSTGSATSGAQLLSQTIRSVNDSGLHIYFNELGLEATNLVDVVADLSKTQRMLGRTQVANQKIETDELKKYVSVLSEVSDLTGMSRDALAKEQQKMIQEERIGAYLSLVDSKSGGDIGTTTAISGLLSFVKSVDQTGNNKTLNALIDMATGGNVQQENQLGMIGNEQALLTAARSREMLSIGDTVAAEKLLEQAIVETFRTAKQLSTDSAAEEESRLGKHDTGGLMSLYRDRRIIAAKAAGFEEALVSAKTATAQALADTAGQGAAKTAEMVRDVTNAAETLMIKGSVELLSASGAVVDGLHAAGNAASDFANDVSNLFKDWGLVDGAPVVASVAGVSQRDAAAAEATARAQQAVVESQRRVEAAVSQLPGAQQTVVESQRRVEAAVSQLPGAQQTVVESQQQATNSLLSTQATTNKLLSQRHGVQNSTLTDEEKDMLLVNVELLADGFKLASGRLTNLNSAALELTDTFKEMNSLFGPNGVSDNVVGPNNRNVVSNTIKPPASSGTVTGATTFAPMSGPAGSEQVYAALMDKITGGEAPDAVARKRGFASSYDVPYGYGQYAMPEKPLTEMTIAEVREFQKKQIAATRGQIPGTHQGTGAVGKLQLVQGTLNDVVKEMGIKETDLFNKELQDAIFKHLLDKRGVGSLLAGKAPLDQVINGISKEWASVKNSQGVGSYRGQNAGTDVSDILKEATGQQQLAGYAKGGIARGPKSGHLQMLHGDEAVVPLPDGRSLPVSLAGPANRYQGIEAAMADMVTDRAMNVRMPEMSSLTSKAAEQNALMLSQNTKLDELIYQIQQANALSAQILQAARG